CPCCLLYDKICICQAYLSLGPDTIAAVKCCRMTPGNTKRSEFLSSLLSGASKRQQHFPKGSAWPTGNKCDFTYILYNYVPSMERISVVADRGGTVLGIRTAQGVRSASTSSLSSSMPR